MRRNLLLATVIAGASLIAGCAGYRQREPVDVKWPCALLARWTTGDSTRPKDSTVFVFHGGGTLLLEDVRVRTVNGAVITQLRPYQQLSWWTEKLKSDDAGARRLCYTARPSRGHICVRYEIDTLAQSGKSARRRLTLARGRSRTVFVER